MAYIMVLLLVLSTIQAAEFSDEKEGASEDCMQYFDGCNTCTRASKD